MFRSLQQALLTLHDLILFFPLTEEEMSSEKPNQLNTGWRVGWGLLTLRRVGLTQPSPSLKGKAKNFNCISLRVLQKNYRDMWDLRLEEQSHHCAYGETEFQRGEGLIREGKDKDPLE